MRVIKISSIALAGLLGTVGTAAAESAFCDAHLSEVNMAFMSKVFASDEPADDLKKAFLEFLGSFRFPTAPDVRCFLFSKETDANKAHAEMRYYWNSLEGRGAFLIEPGWPP